MTIRKKLMVLNVGILLVFSSIVLFSTERILRNSIYEEKQEQTKELVDVGLSVVTYYHDLSERGELSEEAAQRRAKSTLANMFFGPENTDYYWINDFHPRVVMHPFRPDLEGEDVSGVTDPDGVEIFNDFVRVAEEEGAGHVSYQWQYYDNEDRIEPKLSYVTAFEPWGWIIGTGVYIDGVEEAIAGARNILFLIIAVIVGIAAFLGYRMAKSIADRIRLLSTHIRKIAHTGDVGLHIENRSVQDEVDSLMVDVQHMSDNLREKVSFTQSVSEGDWTQEVPLLSDKDALGQALNTMTQQVRGALGKVHDAVSQVDSGSAQISEASQDLSEGATSSAANLEEINSSV
ncbi:MAG: cache domain-containing protein, partial [Fibrobacterota bacterium]